MHAAGAGDGASFWGTLEYVAPEVIQFGSAAYSPAADWWGVGVLLYELLLGLVPWDAHDADQIMEQIKAADVVWPPRGMVSVVLGRIRPAGGGLSNAAGFLK